MSDMPKKIWVEAPGVMGSRYMAYDEVQTGTPYTRTDLVDALVEAAKETKQDETLGFAVDWRATIAALKALED